MVNVDDETRRSIEAAYSAVRAALLMLDLVMARLSAPFADETEVTAPTALCQHRDSQNATVMGGESRMYCRDCRSFVYDDGRMERPT